MSKDPFPHLPEDGRGGSIWLTLRNYLLAGIAVATPLTGWLAGGSGGCRWLVGRWVGAAWLAEWLGG